MKSVKEKVTDLCDNEVKIKVSPINISCVNFM